MNLREFNRILEQTLLVPVLLLLALAAILVWQIQSTLTAQRLIDHSDQVSTNARDVERLIIDQETGLRGYQLTGDTLMLAPFKAAEPMIPRKFAMLRNLLADNPSQQTHLAQLNDRYQIWLGFAQSVMASTDELKSDVAVNRRGKDMMDAIRAQTQSLVQAESELRRERAVNVEKRVRRVLSFTFIGAALAGLLLGLFTRSRLHRVSRAYQASLHELQQRADDLYETRFRYQTTLESIGDAVIACDAQGGVEFMNEVAQLLTGWNLSEAREMPLDQIFHIVNEETREICENPVEKVLRTNTVIGLANHTVLVARNNVEYVIDDSASPIRDQRGKITGVVLIFRDVTDIKRTEAALIASEKHTVAGRLAASIAHEIHNPLDSVANLHHLLASEEDPEKREEFLAMAKQELDRTMQISRAMLSLYREPKAPIRIDISPLIDDVLLLLDRRLADQSISVKRELEPELVVEGFPAELRQVFTNLIVNAADAAGRNGRIGIRTSRALPEESRTAGVMIEISDSGPGISAKVEKNLFQPFFTTKGEQGTGLGLWVSMGIVQKHSGTIRIGNSDCDGFSGAAVCVYLPMRALAGPKPRVI
jgi:PAS domain S-box-containing protein